MGPNNGSFTQHDIVDVDSTDWLWVCDLLWLSSTIVVPPLQSPPGHHKNLICSLGTGIGAHYCRCEKHWRCEAKNSQPHTLMAVCEGLIIDIHEIAGSYSNTIVLEKRLVCGSIWFQMVLKNMMTHHEILSVFRIPWSLHGSREDVVLLMLENHRDHFNHLVRF